MSIIQGSAKGSAVSTGFYPTTIDQSLRFNDNDSAYLSWTPASAGNRKTWTFSTWVKRTVSGLPEIIYSAATNDSVIGFNSTGGIEIYFSSGTYYLNSTATLFRDPSSWYHLVVSVDTTQSTASNRVKCYMNGSLVTGWTTETYPTQNYDTGMSSSSLHTLGCRAVSISGYADAYLAETHFIDGTAYDATAFGEFKNGVWVAKEFAGTYGTNGFKLDFADGGALGNDVSGNNNDWTSNNLASTDVMLDSPTNNFATWNPLFESIAVYSEGNLTVNTGTSGNSGVASSILPSSGKYYWEVCYISYSFGQSFNVGVIRPTGGMLYYAGYSYYSNNGAIVTLGTESAYGSSFAPTDIVGVAFDVDAGALTFYKNGVSQGVAFTGLSGELYPSVGDGTSGNTVSVANFGQDSSFAGNKTPQGYTDANGRGDFYYAPPAGYLALCTANLPEPAIGPNSATNSDENFNTITYTGNGTTNREVTGVGFQPDLTWVKSRSTTNGHNLFDAFRGAGWLLTSQATIAEIDNTAYFTDFTSDGYQLGLVGGDTNGNGTSYVAWNWKADNTSGSTNTDGSITSTVSANVDAGFSIVSWTGNGVVNTVGHGLSQAPELWIMRRRNTTDNWLTYYTVVDGTLDYMYLNLTNSASGSGLTPPTSTVFTDGLSTGTSDARICYAFHSVEGYSKFGSYTGNGSTDGPMVFCGFEPAFVIHKRADSTGSWIILDNKRDEYNPEESQLITNSSAAEADNVYLDFTSNGFKIRSTWNDTNASGGTYIFMAFAKTPTKYSLAH